MIGLNYVQTMKHFILFMKIKTTRHHFNYQFAAKSHHQFIVIKLFQNLFIGQ